MHRSTRRLRLTEEGQVYLELARRVLGEVQEVEASLSNRGAAPRGMLRVSAPAAFGRKHVAPAILAFLSRYPGVSVQLHLSEAVMDLMEEGFDLAVRIGEPKEESFVARKLAANRRVVCASPAFLRAHGVPRRPSDLTRMNCLILGERNAGQGVWTFEGPEGTQRVRVGGTLQCNDSEVIHQWALAGLGLALKSLWDVGASIRQGRLQAVLPDYRVPGADIHALYPHRSASSCPRRCAPSSSFSPSVSVPCRTGRRLSPAAAGRRRGGVSPLEDSDPFSAYLRAAGKLNGAMLTIGRADA